MKTIKVLFLSLALVLMYSCSNDDNPANNPNPPIDPVAIDNPDEEIDDFVWKAMNFWYLYKADVPDLQDSKLDDINSYRQFLASYDSPENLFNDILTKKLLLGEKEDQFSVILDDYVAWEARLQGVSKSNGMEFSLGRITNTDNIFGLITYILPGTDAETKGVKRGEVLTAINGTQLNLSNYQDLLFGLDSYDVGLTTIENNTIQPVSKTVTLTKTEYTENPIFITKTIDYQGQKIGYIMYNGFTFGFNAQLNAAFATLKNEGTTDLILDLRYNGGGSVYTATALASMITGGKTGEVFATSVYNSDIEAIVNGQSNADAFFNERFIDNVITGFDASDNPLEEPINSLGLTKLYVLATGSTASASELIINGLSPHIDVIQIGTNSRGKYQASRTLYNSPDLGREGVNPNHTYALQPLISKVSNIDGNTDFINGLVPDVPFEEDPGNLGILGETSEPFLNAALEYIVNGTLPVKRKGVNKFHSVGESKMMNRTYQRMYIEDLPQKNFDKIFKSLK